MEASERRMSSGNGGGAQRSERGSSAASINVSSGTRLADFDIDYRLGKGAYGVVHRAKRKQDGKLYVIKTIPIGELGEEEKHEAVNEVMLLASISCPYVVKYYDSFMENDELHIVMEYCNRGDLQRIIRKLIKDNCRNVAEEKIWSIFIQVALGLYYLHSRAILHRDMKAANVFIHKDEFTGVQSVKIGDLGVAKLLDSNTCFATTLVGTPYYLSPELCQNKRYNERSDVWSLGVLLYQCCTLKLPFEANNPYVLMCKIIKGKYEPISSRYLSQELVGLVRQLLTPDSDVRPSLKHILSLRFVQERCLQLGLELPADIPVASIIANPSSSSTQALPPLASPFSSTRKLPTTGDHLPLSSQTPRGSSQQGPITAAGGGAAAEPSVPQLAATPAQAPAQAQGGRTPRGSVKGSFVPPPVSTGAARALSPGGEGSHTSLLSPANANGAPMSPHRMSNGGMQARSGGGLKSPAKILTSSSWMPNPFKRGSTISGTQRLLNGDEGDAGGGRDASESEFGSQAVPISPANMPLSPGGMDGRIKAPRSARGGVGGRPLYSVKDLKSATRKDLNSMEGEVGGAGGAEGGMLGSEGGSIANGYKAMARHKSGDEEDWQGGTIGDSTRNLEALEEASRRLGSNPGTGDSYGGRGGTMPQGERFAPAPREELERKCHDMEELIQRTRAQCMEGLSEEAFAEIYRFFTTNVTASRDNALSDLQLAELEQIIMNACGGNVQKSYVVLFNVQKLLAQEERVRELRSWLTDMSKAKQLANFPPPGAGSEGLPTARSDGNVLSPSTTARLAPER